MPNYSSVISMPMQSLKKIGQKLLKLRFRKRSADGRADTLKQFGGYNIIPRHFFVAGYDKPQQKHRIGTDSNKLQGVGAWGFKQVLCSSNPRPRFHNARLAKDRSVLILTGPAVNTGFNLSILVDWSIEISVVI